MIMKRLWQLWYVQVRWLTAFPFYLNIPMAYQCYVINVKLSMLRSTAQHGSASNVILILYFSVFKTEEAWFNLGLSIKRYLRKTSLYFKDLSFSPLSNRLLQKTLLKLKCLIVWGVNVQYLAFVWLTRDFIGCLRHSSLFHLQIGSYCAKLRKTSDVIDVIFVHLIYFPSFSLPIYFPLFLSTFLLVFICNQSLFYL